MADLCHTCGERWCSERHGAAWDPPLCLTCGASWLCPCRGGLEGEWRIDRGPTLRRALELEPVDRYGNLPAGSAYRALQAEDQCRDLVFVSVEGGHVRKAPNPTIWPRPGWREQAA